MLYFSCQTNQIGRRRKVEERWPEYSEETTLLETPSYTFQGKVGNNSSDKGSQRQSIVQQGKAWLRFYLKEHVQKISELKQHHVHIWDEAKKEYVVLEHCKAKGKKNKCSGCSS